MQTVFRPSAPSQPAAGHQGLPVGFVTLRHKAITYELKPVHCSLNVQFSYVIVHVHNSFQSNEIFFSVIRASFSLTENNNLYCVNSCQTRSKFYSQICYLWKVPYSVSESEIMNMFGSVHGPLHTNNGPLTI